MADYAWKMRGQSWSDDSYYVASSAPFYPVEVIAPTRQEAINEAAKILGDPGRHRIWKFFNIEARDVRLSMEPTP